MCRIFRKCYFLFLFLFIVFSCGGKGWDTGHSDMGFYSSPEKIIASLNNGKTLTSCEHFILANSFNEKNELKKAVIHYANSAMLSKRNLSLKPFPSPVYDFVTTFSRKSDYYEDSVLEISRIFFKYSEYDFAYKFADLVTGIDPSLNREAVILKARCLENQKKYDQAIKLLKTYLEKISQRNLTPVIYIRLASVYQKKGDYSSALRSLSDSLAITSDGWQGTTAAKEAYQMIKNNNISAPDDTALIAKGLLLGKDYDASLKLIKASKVDSFEKDTVLTADLLCLGKEKEADLVINKYTSNGDRAKIFSFVSSCLWDKGNKKEAAQKIKELVRITQNESQKELRRLCYYLYDRNDPEAPGYLSLYASRFPKDKNADKMLWLAAKPYIEKKNFSNAAGFLSQMINSFPDGFSTGSARFWIYKQLSAENKAEEAEKTFHEMIVHNASSPYTIILMFRKKDNYTVPVLEALFSKAISEGNKTDALFSHAMLYFKNSDLSERNSRISKLNSLGVYNYSEFDKALQSPNFSSANKDRLLAAEKYFAAGDNESIQRVLNTLSASGDDQKSKQILDRDKAVFLSYFGDKYNNYYYKYKGTENLLDSFNLKENIFLLSEEALDRMYPMSFNTEVDAASSEFKISKSNILAVMKSESEFNHRAMSGVGAAGLMQLMPPTAGDISKKLKQPVYDIKNPQDAIRFGTYYLSWLNKFFKGNFRDVVAGYNAGPGNIQKWKSEYDKSDIDLYTEQIPFDETRAYVLFTEKYLIQYNVILH
jgi:tetratricopeptide (TPR) repeat protein